MERGWHILGKLVLNVGGMFSGKTTELQRQGERHLLAGHSVLFLKPSLDNRYSEMEIVTHKGDKVRAINVDTDGKLNIPDVITVDVVLIDEVQFFDIKLVETIMFLIEEFNATVYCSGLDMDFLGRAFETTAQLMAKADTVNKFHAVCEGCGNDGVFTAKRSHGSDKVVELGAKETYIPLCRSCYKKHMEGC